jgi:hypothetical protein
MSKKRKDEGFRRNDGNTSFHAFYEIINIPVFQYSNIPMFDVLGCGYAARGSLWLDSDDTALVERRRR